MNRLEQVADHVAPGWQVRCSRRARANGLLEGRWAVEQRLLGITWNRPLLDVLDVRLSAINGGQSGHALVGQALLTSAELLAGDVASVVVAFGRSKGALDQVELGLGLRERLSGVDERRSCPLFHAGALVASKSMYPSSRVTRNASSINSRRILGCEQKPGPCSMRPRQT
jgi:hypothetical protein